MVDKRRMWLFPTAALTTVTITLSVMAQSAASADAPSTAGYSGSERV